MGERGGDEIRSIRSKPTFTRAQSESDSNCLISKFSTKLGALKALASFFMKLERLGVGTRRRLTKEQ